MNADKIEMLKQKLDQEILFMQSRKNSVSGDG